MQDDSITPSNPAKRPPRPREERRQKRVSRGLPPVPEGERERERARIAKYHRRLTRKHRTLLGAYKIEQGCADCGYNTRPEALDFDHLPGREKSGRLGQMLWAKKSVDAMFDEISKCEVVCANCHRIRTQQRRQAAEADRN